MQEDLKYRISLDDLFSGGIKNAEHHAQHFEKGLGNLGGEIAHLREEIGLLFFAFESFEYAKSFSEVFVEAQKAAALLQFTVSKRGGLASDFEELVKQSEELGKTSFFNNTEIKKADDQLLNYGISIKKTKEAIATLTDVGVAKNKSLNDIIGAIGMATSGGREGGLKEYGLGFLKLEKDMSVAGAEARNFNKIISAMKKEFAGATDAMSGNEFFKLKKIQDELEDLKEKVGKELMKAFDMMLPYLKMSIEYLTEFGHWVKENSEWIKGLATDIATAVGAFYAFELIMKADAAAVALLNGELAINPIVLAAGAIALLTKGWRDAIEEEEKYISLGDEIVSNYIKQEIENVDRLTESYQKLGETKERAQKDAIEYEKKHLDAQIELFKQQAADLYEASLGEDYDHASGWEKSKVIQESIRQLEAQRKALNNAANFGKSKTGSSAEGQDLGSGISEPKASKIQNITFNLINPFQNQKITMGGGSMDVSEIAPKFTEFLVSLIEDTAVAATE